MKFIVKDVENKTNELSELLNYEINKSVYIPCNSLIVSFLNPMITTQIKYIYAYNEDKLVFDGIVDCQKCVSSKAGNYSVIKARNRAALLVDNECVPCSYTKPSTETLFFNHCKSFGFNNKLPNVVCDSDYSVDKGVSSFGAINSFIRGMLGSGIFVNENNEISLLQPTGHNIYIDEKSSVISTCLSYNRSAPVSEIKYKIGDNDYIFTAENPEITVKEIKRNRCVNLSSYPLWRQKDIVKNIFTSSLKSYNYIQLVLKDCLDANLYDSIFLKHHILGNFSDEYVKEISYIFDSKGERTELTISQDKQVKESYYVAK